MAPKSKLNQFPTGLFPDSRLIEHVSKQRGIDRVNRNLTLLNGSLYFYEVLNIVIFRPSRMVFLVAMM
jgi:hypothetical protein